MVIDRTYALQELAAAHGCSKSECAMEEIALAQPALLYETLRERHGSTPFPTGRYANGYATSATLSTSQGKPLTSRSVTIVDIAVSNFASPNNRLGMNSQSHG
ncbi:hypothetical protein LC653_35860 [Nostoc sp. CHAB 5784]|uniref:hypothetical protein n=1 Tax=Nostoc mirabile TaxID=2907820 RepID=UPI001E629AED|nr:hypothetical protein [Nostoc mirabile]MCC5669092.1 hypothetical protein [Nostoc mirabile CHAB5784]